MQFVIRYYDALRATVVEEVVNAASEEALREQWAVSGRVLLSSRAVASPRQEAGRDARFDVGWWCRELRTLLTAGMTVVEALESLQAQARGGQRERVNGQLLRSLHEGQSLSSAMKGVGAFPQVLLASVMASERTSTLVPALDDFLRYNEMIRGLRRKALSAAIYPAVVVMLGLCIMLFLLFYVVPRFSKMYVDFRGTLSTTTRILLWVSGQLNHHAGAVVAGACALGFAVWWAWRRGRVQRAFGWLAEQIQPLQTQLDHFRLAKLYQSLALMFRGGYTLDEAMQVCAGLEIGGRILQGVEVARSEMARGRAVSTAFAAGALTEPVSERLLAVGERTGGFDAVLQTIADRHAEAFATFVERATRIVEPLLLLLVALVVGGIVVMMYMPIFDIASGIR